MRTYSSNFTSYSLLVVCSLLQLTACSATSGGSSASEEPLTSSTCIDPLNCAPSPQVVGNMSEPVPGPGDELNLDLSNEGRSEEPNTTVEDCANAEVVFEKLIAEVHLVIDRSGTMKGYPVWNSFSWEAPADESRWGILGKALFGDGLTGSEPGIVGTFHETVAFGARFYSASSFTEALKLENYTELKKAFDGTSPGGQTYTAAALVASIKEATEDPTNIAPKSIVLATDGIPTDGTTAVEEAVVDAYSKGIKTYVIFIGDSDANTTHLQNIANLGLGLPADESNNPGEYYTSLDQSGLYDAFSNIVIESRSCLIEVEGEIDQENVDQGEVILNGTALNFEEPNGWQMSGTQTVELLGSSCEALNLGATLEINFDCKYYTPPILR